MSDLGGPSSSVLPASPPDPPSRRRLVLGSAVAGAVVLVLVLGFVFWPRGGSGDTTPVARSVTPTTSTAVPGSTGQAAAPAASLTPSASAPVPASPAPASPASATPAPTATTAARPATTFTAPPHVSGVSTIGAQVAAGLVTGRGIEVPGVVQQAVQWQDRNGRNVLLAAERIDHNRADGGPDAGTIVVMLVAHLDGRAKVLRTLTDSESTPTDPCPSDFGMDVLPGSLTVRDDDHDGVGEATVAWWLACLGDPGQYPVRLALLSGGDRYLLQGRGLPRTGFPKFTDADRTGMGLPAATFSASPARGNWPVNSYARATGLARKLFS